MLVFATKFVAHNPESFTKPDYAYVLSFSTIMLNTDRHNPAISDKDKMTKEQFIRNNRGTWDDQDPPRDLLEQIFDSIINNEINIKSKGDPDKKGWVKAIKGNNCDQGRRWLCLIGNELRWYKSPTMGKGDAPIQGKIILDYVMIKGYNEEFSISLVVPQPMDFYLYTPSAHPLHPKEELTKTMQLIITCENEQQMLLWVDACSANSTFTNAPGKDPSFGIKIPKAPKSKSKVQKRT